MFKLSNKSAEKTDKKLYSILKIGNKEWKQPTALRSKKVKIKATQKMKENSLLKMISTKSK